MDSETALALDRFFGGYYRSPHPATAVEAFHAWCKSPGRDPSAGALMFVRALQRFPDVRAAFETIKCDAEMAAKLLAAASDPGFPYAADAPLEHPDQLDFLWVEFLLTGEREPVRRVVSVVLREDRVRAALVEWAAEKVYLPWVRSARAARKKALAARGIAIDAQGGPATAAQLDFDLLAWRLMKGGWQIREELPFPIDGGFLLHLSMKGAACWSLQSNARRHPIVREVYESMPGVARLPQIEAAPIG